MSDVALKFLEESRDEIIDLFRSVYDEGWYDKESGDPSDRDDAAERLFSDVYCMADGFPDDASNNDVCVFDGKRNSDRHSVPVVRFESGFKTDQDILRIIIRRAYLSGYVDGARGASATDYDSAEDAIDDLLKVVGE